MANGLLKGGNTVDVQEIQAIELGHTAASQYQLALIGGMVFLISKMAVCRSDICIGSKKAPIISASSTRSAR